jgi:GNAT superfamily N-acetyltransferase
VTPVVRLAQFADAQACEQFEAEARRENADAKGAAAFFAAETTAFFVDDDGGFTLVASVDGVAVGFLTARTTRVGTAQVACVVRVFVTAAARRVGIGDALIAVAGETARERGCVRIDALALPGDRDTKNLYERNGIVARLITAAREL